MKSRLSRVRFAPIIIALLAFVLLPFSSGTAAAAGDPYRPAYHYTASTNFMNDPNGLIYHDGIYHMFYQYNPSGTTAGNGSWGHATSTDLVHWKRQPLAISTDATEDVWSGSVVYDRTNSSGFGTRRNPPMVAVYTSFEKATGIQRQALAFSRDDGFTWTKYTGNPVIDIGSRDFRDPKVFWDSAHGGWRMVVALAAEKKVSIYSSSNLKNWHHESDFGPAGAASAVWECPDLFPLPLDGKSKQQKWVLTVSVSGKTQYFVGAFDGTTFTSPDAEYTPPAGTVLNDFEGTDYGDWTTTGTAFGSGPSADGPDVTGRHGAKVVDSLGGADSATGTLTSPAFTISQRYINFLIGGGNHPHVENGSDGPPPGTTFADFEGTTYGDGWAATGDFVGEAPASSNLPGQLGAKVLDTCVKTCDPAVGTISSPDFTIGTDYIDLLVGGGNHPMSGTDPTAVNLVVDGNVVATATGKNSANLDWVAWDTSALKGQQGHIEVVDQRTADWGHLIVDNIVFSDVAAGPWSLETTANLIVDGKVVRSTTGNNGPGLDWASWDLSDLQGKQAQIRLVDTALHRLGPSHRGLFRGRRSTRPQLHSAGAVDRPGQRLLRSRHVQRPTAEPAHHDRLDGQLGLCELHADRNLAGTAIHPAPAQPAAGRRPADADLHAHRRLIPGEGHHPDQAGHDLRRDPCAAGIRAVTVDQDHTGPGHCRRLRPGRPCWRRSAGPDRIRHHDRRALPRPHPGRPVRLQPDLPGGAPSQAPAPGPRAQAEDLPRFFVGRGVQRRRPGQHLRPRVSRPDQRRDRHLRRRRHRASDELHGTDVGRSDQGLSLVVGSGGHGKTVRTTPI